MTTNHAMPTTTRTGAREDLAERFRSGFDHFPDEQFYRFLPEGIGTGEQVTNAQLDLRVRAIAATLVDRCEVGDRVLILAPPGLDYVAALLGCFYAGVVAVPLLPPTPALLRHGADRIAHVVHDSRATAVLAPSGTDGIASALAEISVDTTSLHWLAVDELDTAAAASWRPLRVPGERLALVQYTSGSTAEPKGVMLTRDNVMANLEVISERFIADDPEPQAVIWLPPHHDMGLIGGILQPGYGRFPVTLMPSLAFVKQPVRWLRAISETGASVSGGPNFAFDLCVDRIKPADRQGLDLSRWRVAFSGAEPVRVRTLDRFAQAFEPYGFSRDAFLPCYGLAESTLLVAGRRRGAGLNEVRLDAAALADNRAVVSDADDAHRLVSCGPPTVGHEIVVVDPQTCRALADGQIGELWVRGPSVGLGYWNQPEATHDIFDAHLADTERGPFLRTGDLGVILDEEVIVTGRIKDVIVIAGVNHYPQDIEQSVATVSAAIRPGCGVATSLEERGEEHLVIIQEVRGMLDAPLAGELVAGIREVVAREHGLRVQRVELVRPGSVAKTTSGKLRRSSCRDDFLAGELRALASWSFRGEVVMAASRQEP